MHQETNTITSVFAEKKWHAHIQRKQTRAKKSRKIIIQLRDQVYTQIHSLTRYMLAQKKDAKKEARNVNKIHDRLSMLVVSAHTVNF